MSTQVDAGHHSSRPHVAVPSPESSYQELQKILASPTFHSAKCHKRFLQYVVEKTLAGHSDTVKEYSIGVEVFERGGEFDPRLDNIVRVEARKLRSRLAAYYSAEGQKDPIRIEFPSRGYVPAFRELDAPAEESIAHGSEIEQTAAPSPSDPPVVQPALMTTLGARLLAHRKTFAIVSSAAVLLALSIYVGYRRAAANRSSMNPSIAVLPFQELGGADESFSDGLTDELIDALGRVQGLHVVGRTSAFQFRRRSGDIRDIGKKLNVRTLLEGSIRIHGNRLRITAELEDTSNGYRVWSASYDRDFEDAILVQRDISQAIVSALSTEFAKSGDENPLKLPNLKISRVTVNPQAYTDYLRGVYFWHKQTSDSINTAIGYFKRAIGEDEGFALAYAGLARCYINLPAVTKTRVKEVIPQIRELALKVTQLDSSLAEPHLDLAYASFLNYEWAEAEAEFKKGLELSPSDPVAHRWYATYLYNVGRMQEALAESEASTQLDPFSPYMIEGTGRSLYMMRLYDDAIIQFKKALALDPQYGFARIGLGSAYLQKKMYGEAIAAFRGVNEHSNNGPTAAAHLAYAYALSGDPSESHKILAQFLKEDSKGSFPAKFISEVYMGLGDKDRAFEWLNKAVDAREGYLALSADPIYDSLRSDARFLAFQRRVGSPTPASLHLADYCSTPSPHSKSLFTLNLTW